MKETNEAESDSRHHLELADILEEADVVALDNTD